MCLLVKVGGGKHATTITIGEVLGKNHCKQLWSPSPAMGSGEGLALISTLFILPNVQGTYWRNMYSRYVEGSHCGGTGGDAGLGPTLHSNGGMCDADQLFQTGGFGCSSMLCGLDPIKTSLGENADSEWSLPLRDREKQSGEEEGIRARLPILPSNDVPGSVGFQRSIGELVKLDHERKMALVAWSDQELHETPIALVSE